MNIREKERLKRILQYVGLGVLALMTLAMVFYLMGTPEWAGPFMNYQRR